MKKKMFRRVEPLEMYYINRAKKSKEEINREFIQGMYNHFVNFYKDEKNVREFEEWLKKRNESN